LCTFRFLRCFTSVLWFPNDYIPSIPIIIKTIIMELGKKIN
jgi:hypothetical protein